MIRRNCDDDCGDEDDAVSFVTAAESAASPSYAAQQNDRSLLLFRKTLIPDDSFRDESGTDGTRRSGVDNTGKY